ncbi:uncharacterized protein MICPUCDRAFT_23866 [Micromonas pusilla CCMP1545]|uniref:Predicted protein n=1 Tax=Micromonas pusilla (strain CCMP1545) TaxID=564608 RepID=C1NAI8_MICPC|nr:uncharacterized protein MICPUCDRAFT_23866 [Micromonas pusilla CCMP1545]EEH50896.1 predicted protein [Micromonas pusilla CCMP1545]|eukprot:XP_003064916.1 predicted protein [Micromonas pusilla CCMP1545]
MAQGDKIALLANRLTLRAWAEFGLVLGMFYLADRTGGISDSGKSYDRDLFLTLFLTFAAYGWRTSLGKTETYVPLNRKQTEEWKGWMQVLFLLYHYFKASEVYNAIRIFIAAYVWMTGYGNFSYYYVRKDFGVPRFLQMMWRLNFFVFFTCVVLRNDYMLYYICPMHSLFACFVYFTLLVYKKHNEKNKVIATKFLVCVLMCYVLWEVPGVFKLVFSPFRWLLKYTDPAKPDMDPMHEWFFRSGLDRYVWIHGMLCAFCHPRYDAFLQWIDKKAKLTRVAIQTTIVTFTLLVVYWYHEKVYVLPKLEYNKFHPYTSWIPITCFIILRNLTQTLRNTYVELFCVCGKITLETYVSQFHIWLSTSSVPNGQPARLLDLIPGYPLLNFVVVTLALAGISQRVFYLTNELKNVCLPSESHKIVAHVALGVIIALVAISSGFLVVCVFTADHAART